MFIITLLALLALLFFFTLSTPYTPPGSAIGYGQQLLRILILFLVIRLVILPLIRRNRH